MLIYGAYGIFAHKKTIKEFLQPMIEQVWGGGRGNVPLLLGQFFRTAIFLCRFLQFTNAFFGLILTIFAYFLLYIMCISLKNQTVFWAQNFCDVQLIPNFSRYPAWL